MLEFYHATCTLSAQWTGLLCHSARPRYRLLPTALWPGGSSLSAWAIPVASRPSHDDFLHLHPLVFC